MKRILCGIDGIDCLIVDKLDNEQEKFNLIFALIGDAVLEVCFDITKNRRGIEGKVIAYLDYLKSDVNYYKDVLQKFYTKYMRKRKLTSNIIISRYV